MNKAYRRSLNGVECVAVRAGQTIFVINNETRQEYSSSSALTIKEAVSEAVAFWKKHPNKRSN